METAAASPSRRSWRPTVRDLTDSLVSLLTTAAALSVAIALVDGVSSEGPLPVVVAAVAVAVGDWALRPALRLLTRVLGAVGALLLGVVAQLAVLVVALSVVPGLSSAGWFDAVGVLALTGVVMAAVRWLVGVNDSAYVVADLTRGARASARRHGARTTALAEPPEGVVVVQVDGLSEPVLRFALAAGNLPTLNRWVRSGSHTVQPWWARVPCTTPASQAGLLHGSTQQVPAFRWWEKETGRLVVANRPRDAAVIESRLTTGRGLLADGGVSISNLFSGDAATNLLVMSRATGRRGLGPGSDYLRLVSRPFVLSRTLVRTVAEMVKEVYQGRQQRLRGVEPRVRRGGAYIALRGVTNVLLRDLNVGLVAEHMMAGAPTVFVDLVDYDEIAHHAGPARPESLRALAGLDEVVGLLERVAESAPRRYSLVLLSDHGQSLGATFLQVAGRSLEDVVQELMGTAPGSAVAAGGGEAWTPVNALLSEVLGSRRAEGQVVLGPDKAAQTEEDRAGVPEVVTIASGNLGLVWFPREPGRLSLEEVRERWPALVAGLAAHPAIGVVVAATRDAGHVAVGEKGVVVLETGVVEGEDPLAVYGDRARTDLLHAAALDHTGDLLLVSAVDDLTGEVHAFEELVGSHGGLGGDQNAAVLVHPSGWEVDEDLVDRSVPDRPVLYGAETVHEQMLRWWRAIGVRSSE